MKRFLAMFLSLMLLVCIVSGCSSNVKDLTDEIGSSIDVEKIDLTENNGAVTDFSVRLFKNSLQDGENTLISPLSVLCALSMTANGADGETLGQMESVLGLDVSELNSYVYSYMDSLSQDKKCKISLANSIWIADSDDITVNKDFLQTTKSYYGADVFKTPFDESAKNSINDWVSKKTDGMIEEIINEIPNDVVMYLINALAFDAEWEEKYEKDDISDGVFTTEEGIEQDAEFMFSKESLYLEDENAKGFVKNYYKGEYAFVALLPDEGVSVSEYVSNLTDEHIQNMLKNPTEATVKASIPKFEQAYSTNMNDILINMGMTDAFDDSEADFSKLGTSATGNFVINRVLHKTYISVNEKGTKAGAITAVEMQNLSEAIVDEKIVRLDRPFVYMIVDCENNIPLFIGTVMSVE